MTKISYALGSLLRKPCQSGQYPCAGFPLAVALLLLLTGGLARASVHAEIPIEYELEQAGQVSLAVYDVEGRMVRTLMSGVEQEPGVHTAMWDALDRLGRPVAPGRYTWKVLRTPGFTAKYVGTIGTNVGTAPYDYWVGNHGGPSGIAYADGKMVLSGGAENVPDIVCQSLDDKTHYWIARRATLVEARIVDGRIIGLDLDDWKRKATIKVLDLETGSLLRTIDVTRSDDGATLDYYGYSMATNGKFVAVAYPKENKVILYDLENGEPKGERTVAVPHDLVMAGDRLLAIVDGQIVEVVEDGPNKMVIDAGQLTHPYCLAFDASRNELLVGERAGIDKLNPYRLAVNPDRDKRLLEERKDADQIKRFNLAGELLKTYGRSGGRQGGKFVATDFREINNIVPVDDGSGGFLVGEGLFRLCRLVHMDHEGRVVRQWFGPQQFYNFSVADPTDPRRIIFVGGLGDKTIAEVNYQTGEWDVVENYEHPAFGDGLFPQGDNHYLRWRPQRRNGNLYLYVDGHRPAIVHIDRDHGRILPVAVAGVADRKNRFWRAAVEYAGLDPDTAPTAYTWCDANGNGEIEPEEFTLGGEVVPHNVVIHIDSNWNAIWLPQYWGEQTGEAAPGWFTVRNQGKPTDPAPKWDLKTAGHGEGKLPDAARGLHSYGTDDFYRGGDGATYLLMNGNRSPDQDRSGKQWPTGVAGSNRLIKWNADGSVAWVIGRHAWTGHVPGQFHEPVTIVGEMRGTVVVADKVFTPASAYTLDGLYAGSFFDHRADDGLPGALYVWWRDFQTGMDGPVPYDCKQGGSITEYQGEVYWFPMGNQNTPAYRISGWDDWQRQSGTVTVVDDESQPQNNGTGLRAEFFRGDTFTGEPMHKAVTPRLWCTTRDVYPPRRVLWADGPAPGIGPEDAFAARWTGKLEAKFTDRCRLAAYSFISGGYGGTTGWNREHGDVKVWLGGELIIDTAANEAQSRWAESRWLNLRAGEQYDLRVEYRHVPRDDAHFSLVWETTTQERQRIPTEYLYPTNATADVPTVRIGVEQTVLRGGTTEEVRVELGREARKPLSVRLDVKGTADAADFDPDFPEVIEVPAGQRSTSFSIKPGNVGAAEPVKDVCLTIEPSPEYHIEAEGGDARLLIGSESGHLFPYTEEELVLFEDDCSSSDVWRMGSNVQWLLSRVSGRIEGGEIGPRIPNNGEAFQADALLPVSVDVSEQPIVLYMRCRFTRRGSGGHASIGFPNAWMGFHVQPKTAQGIVVQGHSMSSGHHSSSGITGEPYDDYTTPRDFRVVFRAEDNQMTAEAFILDGEAGWRSIGKITGQPNDDFRLPPPMRQITVFSRNEVAAYIDAVGVAVIDVK